MIITERLVLRPFVPDDIPALFSILSDKEVNRFLPWFPAESLDDAAAFYESRYKDHDNSYAICLKEENVPIGYIGIADDEAHDLGYGLRKEYWHRGIAREAAAAMLKEAESIGLPFVSATHDIANERSGNVLRSIGMEYLYSYEELWMPKGYNVVFRLYQRNFLKSATPYMGYWQRYQKHWIEPSL